MLHCKSPSLMLIYKSGTKVWLTLQMYLIYKTNIKKQLRWRGSFDNVQILFTEPSRRGIRKISTPFFMFRHMQALTPVHMAKLAAGDFLGNARCGWHAKVESVQRPFCQKSKGLGL